MALARRIPAYADHRRLHAGASGELRFDFAEFDGMMARMDSVARAVGRRVLA